MDFTAILIVGGVCVAMPVLIMLLIVRCIMHRTNKRTELMLAIIEKSPDVDVQRLQMGDRKSERERLLNKLMYGCVALLAGVSILVVTFVMCERIDDIVTMVMWGAVLIAIGCALLITYFVGRKQMDGGDGVQ